MKLEYLYPELGNLYGDSANLRYLRKCLPEAEYVETHLESEPAFVSDPDVVFLYSGPMTERGQGFAVEALRPWTSALEDRLVDGMYALFTGNSMELPGKGISGEDRELEGLGLVDFTSRRDIRNRANSLFLGTMGELEIVGFNSRFSHSTPGPELREAFQVVRGIGLEPGWPVEGYRFHNLLGTYLLGPLLVLNPLLTSRLLRGMGIEREPAFFAEALQAYDARLIEFRGRSRKLD